MLKYMNYGDCIDVIDNLEEIEQIIITTPRYRRCCYSDVAFNGLNNLKINF